MPKDRTAFILAAAACLLISGGCCYPCRRPAGPTRVGAAAAVPRPAFDLIQNQRLAENERRDRNGILRNPVWTYQANHFDASKNLYPFVNPDEPAFKCFTRTGAFVRPECTTQQTTCDLPAGWFHPAICSLGGKCRVRGHMNWPMAATYEGALVFDQAAADFDLDYFLYAPQQAGLTTASCTNREKALGIEFDSREIMDRIDTTDTEFWWLKFREAIDREDGAFLDSMKGRFAIITGLMNLDCEHACTAELHPVWAMAIHVKDDPADDVWVLLARNWGNEGFCSSQQHYLDLDGGRYVLRVPWRNRSSAVGVDVERSKFHMNSGGIPTPEITYIPNDGAFVKFTLPRPEDRGFILGELHLQWPDGQQEPMNPVVPIDTTCGLAAQQQSQMVEAETKLKAVRKALQQDQEKLKVYKSQMATLAPAAAPPKPVLTKAKPATPEPTALAPRGTAPPVRSMPDRGKAQADDAEGEALCRAFNDNIPGMRGVCGKRRRP